LKKLIFFKELNFH